MRYKHRVSFLIDTDTWERMDAACHRLGMGKATFMRFCLLPMSVNELSADDHWGYERRMPDPDSPKLANRPRRALTLTLDDTMYEIAWRLADKRGVSLTALLRGRIASLLDMLDAKPGTRLPSQRRMDEDAAALLAQVHSRSPGGLAA